MAEEKTDYERAMENGFNVLSSEEIAQREAQVTQTQTQEHTEQPPANETVEVVEETKPVEAVNTEAFDYEKAYGGRFKSVDEFNTYVQESENARQKAIALEQELNSAKNVNPFEEDAELYKISQLSKKTGIKDFDLLDKVISGNLDEMKPLEIVKLQQKISDTFVSDRRLSKEYKVNVEDYLKEYNVESAEDLTSEQRAEIDEEIKDRTVLLEKDAKKSKAQLLEMRNVEIPTRLSAEQIQEEHNKKVSEFVGLWEPKMDEIGTSLEKFSVKTNILDGEYTFDVDIKKLNEQSIKNTIAELTGYLFKTGAKPTDEEIQKAKAIATEKLFYVNREKIISDIVSQAVAKGEEEIRKAVHNPSYKSQTDKPVNQKMSDYDKRKSEGTLGVIYQ